MVIEKILKQLTPERVKKENEVVHRVKLPREIKKFADGYRKIGDPRRVGDLRRGEYFWKWIFKTTSMITSPTVDKRYRKSLPITKALLFMFDTLLDDVADKTKNKILLRELIKVPFDQDFINLDRLNPTERKYLFFAKRLWNYIKRAIKKYPRYREFQHLFEFDVQQLLNTMNYSFLINVNPYLINKTEFWLYLPANMTVMICSTIDLMCSFRFKAQELGKIREIFSLAQEMPRIGNWVSTWEREIEEKDFTSGIWAYAIDRRILNIDEFQREKAEEIIDKIKKAKIEKILLSRWEKNYIEILKLGEEITSFDVKKLLLMLKHSIWMHLTSKGYK